MRIRAPSGATRTKHTWQEALAAGRHGATVFRWLMEVYGGELSRWQPRSTILDRMVADAERLSRQYHLDPRWAKRDSHAVRNAYRYILDIRQHGAHDHLGVPRDWRERREEYVMTEEQIAIRLAEHREQRRIGALITNQTKQEAALLMRGKVHLLRRVGLHPTLIAEQLSISRSAVYDHLKHPDPTPPDDLVQNAT